MELHLSYGSRCYWTAHQVIGKNVCFPAEFTDPVRTSKIRSGGLDWLVCSPGWDDLESFVDAAAASTVTKMKQHYAVSMMHVESDSHEQTPFPCLLLIRAVFSGTRDLRFFVSGTHLSFFSDVSAS